MAPGTLSGQGSAPRNVAHYLFDWLIYLMSGVGLSHGNTFYLVTDVKLPLLTLQDHDRVW